MSDLIAHLVSRGVVSFLAMDQAVQHMRKVGGRLSSSILETTDTDPQSLAAAIAGFFGIQHAPDAVLANIDPDVPEFWRNDTALRLGAIPLALDSSGLTLGVLEPLSQLQLAEVGEEYGDKITQLLVLEFRFFELCNRFFNVVLDQRYAIWASRYPLQLPEESPQTPPETRSEPSPSTDVRDRTTETTESVDSEGGYGPQTLETEAEPTSEPKTLETEPETEAETTSGPKTLETEAAPEDSTDIETTGPSEPFDLLGNDDSYDDVFGAGQEHTDETLPSESAPKPDPKSTRRPPTSERGKEPSQPRIVAPRTATSGARRVPGAATYAADQTTAEPSTSITEARGREPFPSAASPTHGSGAFRMEQAHHRSAPHRVSAEPQMARNLGLTEEDGSWRATYRVMDALSNQERSSPGTLTTTDIQTIYEKALGIEDLLYATLQYFAPFFERRFLMHFWQPYRTTGLLMQGVRDHTSPFSRIEVPYDDSAAVYKMRKTGNYLQGSPVDIGFLTLYSRLGITRAKEAIAMPIRVQDNIVMMLLMDNGTQPALQSHIDPAKIAALLQQLGQRLSKMADESNAHPQTPSDNGETGRAERQNTQRTATAWSAESIVDSDLLEDASLPAAPDDRLEAAMDSVQIEPVHDDPSEPDSRLDELNKIFGAPSTPAAPQRDADEESGSLEIPLGKDDKLSPEAAALLEQDTRHNDLRAVSIIVGDDERSDADIALDLIPRTSSDLIRIQNQTGPAEETVDGASNTEDAPDAPFDKHKAPTGKSDLIRLEKSPGEEREKNAARRSRRTTAKQVAVTAGDARQSTLGNAEPSTAQPSNWAPKDLARLLGLNTGEISSAHIPIGHITGQQEPLPDATNALPRRDETTGEQDEQDEQDEHPQESDEIDDEIGKRTQIPGNSRTQNQDQHKSGDNTSASIPSEEDANDPPSPEDRGDNVELDDNANVHADDTIVANPPNATHDDSESAATLWFSHDPNDALASSATPSALSTTREQPPVSAQEPDAESTPDDDDTAPDDPSSSISQDRQEQAARLQAILAKQKREADEAAATDTHLPAHAPINEEPKPPLGEPSLPPSADTRRRASSDDDEPDGTLILSPQPAKIGRRSTAKQRPYQLTPTHTQEQVSVIKSERQRANPASRAEQPTPSHEIQHAISEVASAEYRTSIDRIADEVSDSFTPQNPENDTSPRKGDTVHGRALPLGQSAPHDDNQTSHRDRPRGRASLVQIDELTEGQRRMGTTALKPLSLSLEALLDGDENEQREALEELIALPKGELPDIHTVFPGPLTLERRDPEQARRSLAQHGPLLALVDARLYDYIPQLWACLERRDPDARYYALRFLALIRNLQRRYVLTERALDSDGQVRDLALRQIEAFRNTPDFLTAVETFRTRLRDNEPRTRLVAIEALSTLHDHNSIPNLIESLEDPDRSVRKRAHKALMRLTFIDCGEHADDWQRWRELHGNDLPEQWLVDAIDAIEPVRRALAARALENISDLTVNYHPEMSPSGLQRAKMTVERHFGLRR